MPPTSSSTADVAEDIVGAAETLAAARRASISATGGGGRGGGWMASFGSGEPTASGAPTGRISGIGMDVGAPISGCGGPTSSI